MTMQTQRLVLRKITLEDAPRVQELVSVPEVAAGTIAIPYPYPDGGAEVWILSMIGHEKNSLSRSWAIDFGKELVGAISLSVDEENMIAEIHYWLGVPYWGKGIMSEAGLAVVKYGFEELGLEKIYGRYFVSNPASGRVLQKIGMTYEGHLRKHVMKGRISRDLMQYSIIKSEFEKTFVELP